MLINVVDASSLERNLYLTPTAARAGDPLRRRAEACWISPSSRCGIDIDAPRRPCLGCPVIPLVSTRGRGIEALKIALTTVIRRTAILSLRIHYPQPLLLKLTCWRSRCQRRSRPGSGAGWVTQMLEGDIYSRAYAGDAPPPINWISPWRISATRSDDPALRHR
ncbi:hypothetical protein LNP74_10395 [Klebsiella pneumoniae subsp. pneumoniae]|nr:hypothetical protein [Klebsiella pneumoniae subsp. pneumoniae]